MIGVALLVVVCEIVTVPETHSQKFIRIWFTLFAPVFYAVYQRRVMHFLKDICRSNGD
jgi:hypothetical protein